MKLQPLLYLPVGRTLIEHAYPMLRCTAYTVSPVHLLQVQALQRVHHQLHTCMTMLTISLIRMMTVS